MCDSELSELIVLIRKNDLNLACFNADVVNPLKIKNKIKFAADKTFLRIKDDQSIKNFNFGEIIDFSLVRNVFQRNYQCTI